MATATDEAGATADVGTDTAAGATEAEAGEIVTTAMVVAMVPMDMEPTAGGTVTAAEADARAMVA